MNYDFKNKAIKCETWEQMEHLASFAREQGKTGWMFSEQDFNDGWNLFALNDDGTNYINIKRGYGKEIISYSDFISNQT